MKEVSVDGSVDPSYRSLLSRYRASTDSSPDARDIQGAVDKPEVSIGDFCSRMRIAIPGTTLSNTADGQAHVSLAPQITTTAIAEVDTMHKLSADDGPDQSRDHMPESPDHELLRSINKLAGFGSISMAMGEPDLSATSHQNNVLPVTLYMQKTGDSCNLCTQNTLTLGIPKAQDIVSESESSPGSSWIVITPNSDQSKSPSPNSQQYDQALPVMPEGNPPPITSIVGLSKDYLIPRRTRRPRTKKEGPQAPMGTNKNDGVRKPGKRGAFKNEKARQETAQTRVDKCCIRCRMQQIRCIPDPTDPGGVCQTCKNVKRQIYKLPCLRWIITDSSLYREQDMPYQMFSERWQSMDLVDVDTWASSEVKTVYISQIHLDAPHVARVREFIPLPGDMLEEQWMSSSGLKSHPVPRYALADIHESARVIESFIDENIANYFYATANGIDNLFWHTYYFAFWYLPNAKTEKERGLLLDCFRLWVACRKTSHPEHIYGEDKLGGSPVNDSESPFDTLVPAPILMSAQLECILYTRVLRPKAERVLRQLNDLVKDNKRENWLTIYLTMFILLHSCSMITRRDWETARQYNLPQQYANPSSIRKHHSGCQTMLAHYHYLNKGAFPFHLTNDQKGREELKEAAGLDDRGLQFVWETSHMVRDHRRATLFEAVRENRDFGNDLFWVSQLYDDDWQPGPTA